LALPTPAPLRGIVFTAATVVARRGLFQPVTGRHRRKVGTKI
jgi:hypothetical protein